MKRQKPCVDLDWSFIEEKKTDAFDDFDCTKQGKLFKFKRDYF